VGTREKQDRVRRRKKEGWRGEKRKREIDIQRKCDRGRGRERN
jgi:hypothetical protein